MTTSSSSVPILGPVLYFTSTDGYSYDVDNRPLFHLDTNIRHINTSLVGLGYGEHASLAGGLLTPGRVVSLFPNGSIFYPTTTPSVNVTENIVGLVIGATDSGLNRVIWSSKHLDLDVLGLTNIVAGAASGSYLTTTSGSNGQIYIKSTPTLSTDYVVGRVKIGSYIEINTASDLLANDVAITVSGAVKDNHANMYGLTRLRNLLLYLDIGQTPVQYSKRTVRQSDYSTSIFNPMNVSFDGTSIASYGTDTTNYGTLLTNKVLKESYTQFLTNSGTDAVMCGNATSSWSSTVYSPSLQYLNGSENYDLQAITMNGLITGTDYSQSNTLPLFKSFQIDKYYQYEKTTSAPLAGNIMSTATVFNPLNTSNGGELTRIIVWDFYSYNSTTGLETNKSRVITLGETSEIALADTTIFPTTLITA